MKERDHSDALHNSQKVAACCCNVSTCSSLPFKIIQLIANYQHDNGKADLGIALHTDCVMAL